MAPTPTPGISIVVGPGPWLYALAVLATTRELPEAALRILEANAGDPGLKAVIVRAFQNQSRWKWHRFWQIGCRPVLAEAVHAADRRALLVSSVSAPLAHLPRDEFLGAMQSLHDERRDEVDPELRIVLGQVRVAATEARIAPQVDDDTPAFE